VAPSYARHFWLKAFTSVSTFKTEAWQEDNWKIKFSNKKSIKLIILFSSNSKMASCNEEKDFFEPLMENGILKNSFLVLSIVLMITLSIGCYGIAWFIQHSSMAKPTLINRFIAKAYITGLQFILFIQVNILNFIKIKMIYRYQMWHLLQMGALCCTSYFFCSITLRCIELSKYVITWIYETVYKFEYAESSKWIWIEFFSKIQT